MKINSSHIFGIGKRKTAIAKVQILPGSDSGKIFINNVEMLKNSSILKYILRPLIFLKCSENYDINIFVRGGGYQSQIDAMTFGLAFALSKLKKEYFIILKKNFFLIHDSRSKERKKYGLKKARKASQYSKR